jgi:hypothetical protein
MSIFNFYTEIEENFEYLMPDRKPGLVIFLLYHKQKKGELESTFSEDEIINAIKEIRKELKTEQREQFNTIIKSLQKYYLWRDEEKKVYRFRPLASKLCDLFNEILVKTFSPTEIQKDFKYILNKLKEETDFGRWVQFTFESYKDKVNIQVSALDSQMSDAIIEFRSKLSTEESYNISDLRLIIERLNEIGSKTEELNAAFSSSHDITQFLTELLEEEENSIHLEKIHSVINFFKEIRGNLQIISKNIDRIKPKLNEYVRDINRKDFQRKYKTFLKYVLNESTLSKKQVNLPPTLPLIPIGIKESPKFIIVKENWEVGKKLDKRSRKIIIPNIDQEANFKRKILLDEESALKQRVKNYLKELDEKLKNSNEVNYSNYFFEILKKEDGNINALIKLSHLAMSKYHKDRKYGVSITDERVNQSNSNVSIWKTIIYRKV